MSITLNLKREIESQILKMKVTKENNTIWKQDKPNKNVRSI